MNPHMSEQLKPAGEQGPPASVDTDAPRLVLPNGEEWPLTGETLGIGRRIGNHILVDDPLVSSEHAKIVRVGQDCLLLDLRSSNGTFVNGQRVRDLHVLQDRDQIEVGDQHFQFVGAPSPGSPFQPASPAAATSDQAIEVELGVLLLKELLLSDQELTIGRAAGNGLVLDDPRVSTEHAKIIRVGLEYWLLDLRSSNGTFVNEQRVRDVHRLRDGDTIVIAAMTLTFVRRKIRLDGREEVELEVTPSFVFADVSGRRWRRARLVAAVAIVLVIICSAVFVRFVMQ